MDFYSRRWLGLWCVVALGCEPSTEPAQAEGGSTGGGSSGDAVAADTRAEPDDGGQSTAADGAATTGSMESTSRGEGTSGGEDTTTDTGGQSTSSGGDTETSGGSTESGGEESDSTDGANDDPCVTDCGLVVAGTKDEDFGACFYPQDDCRNDCDLPMSCGSLTYSDAMLDPDIFVANAHCFLEALAGEQPLRVEYQVAFNEYDVRTGSIFLFGDGTAALDFNLETHCGNGGSYSIHPYATGTTGVDTDYGETSGCLASTDPFTLLDCTLGTDYASSIEGFPWLDDTCSDEVVTCGGA